MKQLTQDEAQSICQRVLKHSTADDCSVSIAGNRNGNIRFAYRNVAYVPRPNQERIRRVGRSLITVPAALHHQAQIILTREVDRSSNVIRILRRNCEYARFREPRIYPSQGLRQAWMVADKIWVLDIRDQVFALGSIRVFDARVNRKVHRNQISVNLVVEALPRCFGRPVCIRRAPPAKGLARKKARRRKRHKCGQTRSLQECSSVHDAVNPPSHSAKGSSPKLQRFCHSERIPGNP